ncbi:MAG: hypothetical protein GC149_14275 [Gammaproteobacteria bacterium]|nr:hypothetical protein [Gammaproteobacteria bacterium]
MRLGLVVTDERCGQYAFDLLDAALARGWSVRCFFSDRGVLVLGDSRVSRYLEDSKVMMSLCELSVERYPQAGEVLRRVGDGVLIGGQYQDAELVRNSDQVIVL